MQALAMTDPLSHAVFCAAIEDIESLGVRVSQQSSKGARPYAVVGGRSNARWWLIPLQNRHVASSGFALFQPLLPSAYLMRAAASTLSWLGLSRLWVRQTIYISGESSLAQFFPQDESLTFAYFTGTDSPHRKLAVQVMDDCGNLKGFAKHSRNSAVQALLAHEANVLTRLAAQNLQAVHLPSLLHAGEHNGTRLLVTDTLKTAKTKTVTSLNAQHLAFLQELAQKTSGPQDGRTFAALKRRYAAIADRLAPEWRQRFEQGLGWLESSQHGLLPPALTHGDFTPWNTFFVDGKLYVFDWEYAETEYPSSNDLFHFLLASPGFRNKPTEWQARQLVGQATRHHGIEGTSATDHLIVYLFSHTLRHIERVRRTEGVLEKWDGSQESASLTDAVLKLNPNQ